MFKQILRIFTLRISLQCDIVPGMFPSSLKKEDIFCNLLRCFQRNYWYILKKEQKQHREEHFNLLLLTISYHATPNNLDNNKHDKGWPICFDFQQSVLCFRISTLIKRGLDQAEQICTLCVHMFSCMYCTLPGAILDTVSNVLHFLCEERPTHNTRYRCFLWKH